MKVYTKTGDKGTTSLVNGTRVGKDDLRLEAYGTLDELSAFIAVLMDSTDKYNDVFKRIQERLLVAECLLATDETSELRKQLPQMEESDVEGIEKFIDEMNETLKPLNSLIIPGGNLLASKCHVCRTVCRRAERSVVRMSRQHEVNPVIMRYLNRLSDMFFVMSRVFMEGDNKWQPGQ
ncbi:MAG: cob(I)yrinic acid a,c-diamide adenosyltransferase [Bacteroidales bacterium]|nr:cob(I)yrinic acid a,c-diamide adenosyltransferase [Bacteroidales bacterium]